MVPVTEVAFMPGIIASDTIMVGLGQDYYVERRPQDAQAVLRRRMGGAHALGALSHHKSMPPRLSWQSST
ncbi:unnamed protein product, partial [Scytosiphon promiscuus]